MESLGIFSLPIAKDLNLKKIIRHETLINLFYDNELERKIEIRAEDNFCEIKFEDGEFYINAKKGNSTWFNTRGTYSGISGLTYGNYGNKSVFKFYRFRILESFPYKDSNFLIPPEGVNLLSLILTNISLRKTIADIFREYNLRIVLKPQESKIEVQKEIEDIIISYPYSLVSETLQRIIFHLAAIKTNKGSVIIFEEPEAHAFPYYTKFLAEKIALDRNNQYFISTHNPYFLLSLLEKTPKEDIGVFITYFEDYQTKIKMLSEKKLAELLELDASLFFNLDKFLSE